VTVEELLARHLDFMATPRRHFFEQLAFFAAGARTSEAGPSDGDARAASPTSFLLVLRAAPRRAAPACRTRRSGVRRATSSRGLARGAPAGLERRSA
jgi:hypothetical protein